MPAQSSSVVPVLRVIGSAKYGEFRLTALHSKDTLAKRESSGVRATSSGRLKLRLRSSVRSPTASRVA